MQFERTVPFFELEEIMKKYDIIIVGAGASGVFMSYELAKLDIDASVLMLDKGAPLEKRQCPIKKGAGNCLKCEPCHIMNGYGGAGTLSDGKYNITTQFGGDLHNYVGTEEAMNLMEYVDQVLCSMGGADAKLYSTASSELKTTRCATTCTCWKPRCAIWGRIEM